MFGLFNKEILGRKWLLLVAIIIFIILVVLSVTYFWFEIKYQNEIYPNIHLGEFELSGYTVEEARNMLSDNSNILNQGVSFAYEDQVMDILPSFNNSADFQIDLNNSLYQAYNYGRDGNIFVNLNKRVQALFLGKDILLSASFDRNKLKHDLKTRFGAFENEMQESSIVLNNDGFAIREGKEGQEFDYDVAINQFEWNVAHLQNNNVQLSLATRQPTIFVRDIKAVTAAAQAIVDLAPLQLVYDDFEQDVEKNLLVDWLQLQNQDKEVIVSVDQDKVKQYLETEIKTKINRDPTDAQFERVGDRVTVWSPAKDGLDLDIEKTIKEIVIAVAEKKNKIELAVGEIKSLAQSSKDAEELGLKEIIGVGKSDFSGSPTNRRHNIQVGVDKLYGILIKPDEEFSLLSALGKVDADAGYLPELVIKDAKTTPEFGGGLCQIATTVFRSVLNSGMPVTFRRNHSYRVAYYEPAGTDATIYDPAPDFKFLNDTGHYVLLITKLDGNLLTFTFWGTKDGRKVEMGDPVISNIVKPKESKLIETTDLPVGQKKCTERAHNGADAYFDYKVNYPDGKVAEQRYSSHYVPWQEVCLIGVKELTKPQTEEEIIGVGSNKWDALKTE
jgi:vancomycin resistance protein YoaR